MLIWQHPQHFPELKKSQVHIWRANLDWATLKIETLVKTLSTDELDRANRFRFVQHKSRFIAARGILRQLLGNYLAVNPSSLRFDYTERGKPLLEPTSKDISLEFNLSHSHEYAIFGFTINRLIGVDIEYQKTMPEALKIARRFFSNRESIMLAELPQEKQAQLFFQLWTAKEAYLKAIGTGLAGTLSKVEIEVNQDRSLYFSDLGEDTTFNWCLHSYFPATNYLGAIAFNTHIPVEQINFWCWESQFETIG